MSIESVANKVHCAESSAADVVGNMEEAVYLIDKGRVAEAVERLEWAKKNVNSLPYHIDEALTAARQLLAKGARHE